MFLKAFGEFIKTQTPNQSKLVMTTAAAGDKATNASPAIT
jgi:hypothetical protein